MKTILSPRAEKDLKKINKLPQIAIAKKIRSLTSNPTNITKLSGSKDIYRERVGNYRIVYQKTKTQIYIIIIGHRSNIYEMLKRLIN